MTPPPSSQEYVDISTIGIDAVAPLPSPLPSSSDKATVSYWMATTSPDQLPPSLSTLPAESDVVVIGAGITGISTAYHLVNSASSSKKISSITVIEARSFCSGATGRNGGHLTAASALAFTDLVANPNHLLGERIGSLSAAEVAVESVKVVEEVLQFESDTADAIRDIIAEEHAEDTVGFTDDSNWHICFESAEVDAFEDSLKRAAEHAGLRKFVERVRRVPKSEVDERMNHPVGIQAVYEIPGATLHPRALVCLLYKRAQRMAEEKGIELNLITDLPVLKVAPSPKSNVLTTAKGEMTAKYVVHATNGYASHLLPHLSSADGGIIPTRAQVVAIAPMSGRYLWGTALSAGGGYEYGHQRPASESNTPLYILGGGREHAVGREWGVADDSAVNDEVSAFLHPYLAKIFPNSYGTEVRREWTGVMGYTKSKDPLVGPVRGKEYVAAGYSGHGMTRAYGCAKVVAEMIMADARGEKWEGKGGFPVCYLTEAGKKLLAGRGVDGEATLVQGDNGTEKEMPSSPSSADTMLTRKEEQQDVQERPASRSTSVSCCTVS